ncbi:MAG: Tethering factor for nuclear proteasome sts1, partial [Vezdaea aestivalis]
FPFNPMSSAPLSKKRKADSPSPEPYADDRMSASPSASPALQTRPLSTSRHQTFKRARPNTSSRALSLPRLLETLDAEALRNILSTLTTRHPDLIPEVISLAPRLDIPSALQLLSTYESTLRSSFPIGPPTSDYAYHRVKQPLLALISAMSDFTPHFLPPHEPQPATTLEFLDAATGLIHRLPDWENPANHHHKNIAYEEMAKAWALAVKEAGKRGGGMQLVNGGWEEKIRKHNVEARGKLQRAVDELDASLGWMSAGAGQPFRESGQGISGDHRSIRQELLAGTYGTGISVGPW